MDYPGMMEYHCLRYSSNCPHPVCTTVLPSCSYCYSARSPAGQFAQAGPTPVTSRPLVVYLALHNSMCSLALYPSLSLSAPTHSHKQASSGDTMHTKLAGKDLPTPTSSARSPPPPAVPPPPPSSSTSAAAPDIEITDESGLPKNSEPNSPLSEEDFSSGGEQVGQLCVCVCGCVCVCVVCL